MKWFERKKPESASQTTQEKAELKVTTSVKAPTVGSSIILRPLVTEKGAHLAATGQYLFEVNLHANKVQIKNAIRSMYGVMPTSVNIQKVRGKAVRFGRMYGRRKDWKKAIVTLPEGKKIEVYEGV